MYNIFILSILKRFGHVKRREVMNKARAAIEWRPEERRPMRETKETVDRWYKTRLRETGSYESEGNDPRPWKSESSYAAASKIIAEL